MDLPDLVGTQPRCDACGTDLAANTPGVQIICPCGLVLEVVQASDL